MQAQWDFVDRLEVRKVRKNKNQRLESKMGKSKTIVSDMRDTIRNTLVGMANALSGSEGAKIDTGKLRDVGRLFHLDDEVGIAQKS